MADSFQQLMRRRFSVLCLVLLLTGMMGRLSAETVRVEGIEGRVLYGAGDSTPTVPVKAGQVLGPGTFSASSNGILYLSTFTGSDLRLAEAGTLHFDGVEEPCRMEHAIGRRSIFRLLQGKLRVTIRYPETPPRCYRIVLTRGAASVESGQCVMCMHGDGTYLYVARGVTWLAGSGRPAAPAGVEIRASTPALRSEVIVQKPVRIEATGSVGLLDSDGTVRVRPLSVVSTATQNCLLAGFKPDTAGGGSPAPVDPSLAPVSPIQ